VMLRAGLSYSDWRLMTNFQRKDFMARHTVAMSEVEKKMSKAKPGEVAAMLVAKLMGFM